MGNPSHIPMMQNTVEWKFDHREQTILWSKIRIKLESDERKPAILAWLPKSMGTNFPGSSHRMGFVAFSHAMVN